MGKLVDKFLAVLGFDLSPEADNIPGEETAARWEEQGDYRRKGNLVSLPPAKPVKMVLQQPRSYDEAQGAVDHLKNKRPVVVNLGEMDVNEARRLVDFLSGATYALNGKMKKIGEQIFIFAPSNVELMGYHGLEERAYPGTFLGRSQLGE